MRGFQCFVVVALIYFCTKISYCPIIPFATDVLKCPCVPQHLPVSQPGAHTAGPMNERGQPLPVSLAFHCSVHQHGDLVTQCSHSRSILNSLDTASEQQALSPRCKHLRQARSTPGLSKGCQGARAASFAEALQSLRRRQARSWGWGRLCSECLKRLVT